jgi:membrane protease YdiL (CAAX protease family)
VEAAAYIYIIIMTIFMLSIPSSYFRALISISSLLLILYLRGEDPKISYRAIPLSSAMAFMMTLPFLLVSDVEYSGANLELGEIVPWHLSIATWEESVYRGYILGYSPPQFIFSSIIFSLIHSQNPGFGLMPFIGILSAGIFLCLLRVSFGLLPAISFHFCWNIFLEHLWGFPTSGIIGSSIFSSELRGDPIITGGSFGPEGSIIALIEFSVGSAVLYMLKRV